jgi:hypothetical protein
MTGNESHRVIFMHVPKTAGSSISLFMKSHFGSSRSHRVVTIGELEDQRVLPEQIDAARKAQYVGGHFGWDTLEKIRGDAFVFTFLRDPVQRLKSMYWHRRGERKNGADFARRHPTFRSFIESNDPEILLWTNKAMTRQLMTGFADPAPCFLTPKELASAAISNLKTVDYVGFTERFESDFTRIAARTGLPVPAVVPRVNVSADRLVNQARDWARAPVSEADRNLAERLVAADRILFEQASSRIVDGRFTDLTSRTGVLAPMAAMALCC